MHTPLDICGAAVLSLMMVFALRPVFRSDRKGAIRAVLAGPWVEMHVLKPASAAYMAELKDRGYSIYILSNLSVESHAFVSRYDFFRLADGGGSAEVRRNDLAQKLGCVPSQISYVITSRFSVF